MNLSLLFRLLSLAAVGFLSPAFAQDTPDEPVEEEVATEEAPALGIIFLKPPERPLLGNVSNVVSPTTALPTVEQPTTVLPSQSSLTEEILNSFDDPIFASFLRAVGLDVNKVGTSPKYRFQLEGENVNLPSGIQANLKLNPILFGAIDHLELVGSVTLERDFSLEEVKNNSIIYNQIEIENIDLDWGGVAFSGDGAFIVDSRGMLNGALQLTVTSWNNNVKLDDFIPGGQALQIEILLSVLTSGDELTLPISLENGIAKIGQMVIGVVPSIYQ